jgi:hypothetical protein
MVAALVVLSLVPAAARADVDPASDILLLQDAFIPQSPPPPQDLVATLQGQLKALRKAGFPLKVAIIGASTDLGGVPQMFGKPQEYARFLGTELRGATGRRDQPLLVVMAAGFGTFSVDAKVAAAVRGVKIGQGGNPDLIRAAIEAVSKMAAAAGHPIKTVTPGGGGSSGAPVAVFVLPVLLLGAVGLILSRRKPRDT